MKTKPPEDPTQSARVMPLVRATHHQIEIDYLPPYGDPEVSIPGEVATYFVMSGLVIELLERFKN